MTTVLAIAIAISILANIVIGAVALVKLVPASITSRISQVEVIVIAATLFIGSKFPTDLVFIPVLATATAILVVLTVMHFRRVSDVLMRRAATGERVRTIFEMIRDRGRTVQSEHSEGKNEN